MKLGKKPLSYHSLILILCGMSFYGCSNDEPIPSPEDIAGALPVTASSFGGTLVGGGFEFGIISGEKGNCCRVEGFVQTRSHPDELIIPGKLLFENKIYKVIEIGDRAFFSRENIISVVLPDEIEEIDDASFKYCSSLERVVLSKNLREIGDGAFYECQNLKDLQLPEGLESIGYEAFVSCYGLDELTLPSTLKEIGEYSLTNCYLTKLVCLAKNPPKFEYEDTSYHYPDFLRIGETPIYVPRDSYSKYMASEWGMTYKDQIYPL